MPAIYGGSNVGNGGEVASVADALAGAPGIALADRCRRSATVILQYIG